MSRFFKSAAFPSSSLSSWRSSFRSSSRRKTPGPVPSYGDFITQLEAGQVKTVDVKTKDNTIVVKPRTGAQYERGFLPDNAPHLESELPEGQDRPPARRLQHQGRDNGWLSLLTYVLPFLIFIGFWIFLMNRMPRHHRR